MSKEFSADGLTGFVCYKGLIARFATTRDVCLSSENCRMTPTIQCAVRLKGWRTVPSVLTAFFRHLSQIHRKR